ncbi:MAG TPA: hypothetical protein VMT34_10430 [Aggregatilineales bacterium]|nr:hypothetical protein [Aggregatilineales bacterium]
MIKKLITTGCSLFIVAVFAFNAYGPRTTVASAAPTSTPGGTSTAYAQSGGSVTRTDQTYMASSTDESAVYVTNGGTFDLTNATITSSGNTSSQDNSSFHGLNAAVLAADGSTIKLSNSSVTTSGTGANGVFATGTGSSVTLSRVTIKATADGGHAVMATNAGSLVLTDVDMVTAGAHSGAIATDRGGGTISVTGGTVVTSGQDSPGIYSTGAITVTGATITAMGAEAAVIEGANSITLTDTKLSTSKEDKWGVMIYQSMSGDAEGTKGTFTMTGGSLAYSAANGPLFYVTNSTGVITLTDVNVATSSGILVKVASNDRWGTQGSNGGTVVFTANKQTLTGNLVADSASSITATFQNGSSLTGSINTDNTAKAANLTLDASSTWTVTADSYLASLSDAGAISGASITNIIGSGHDVHYDANLDANSQLGGLTYSLVNGGKLIPNK